ncbi:MAG: TIGR04551 family protein, partial [Myxococcales bacterium]|nr:TIGR04551 family protein [Myxococcales bacterium]
MLRRRLHVCLWLALAAPLLAPTPAHAQAAAPPPSPTATPAPPPSAAPPPTAPVSPGPGPSPRPALVPGASPVPGPGSSPASSSPAPATSPTPSPAGAAGAPGPAAGTPPASSPPGTAAAAPSGPSLTVSPADASSPAPIVNPARDEQDLAAQGAQRPASGEVPSSAREVWSDDWWGRARPVIEMHGYFRTRAELFHNFSLGRHSSSALTPAGASSMPGDPAYLFPIPADQSFTGVGNTGAQSQNVNVCGNPNPMGQPAGSCSDRTESGANLRLRLDPEIHISDNLRIVTEIHLLDNLVLGSTPDAYAMQPATSTTTMGTQVTRYPSGYQPAAGNGYAPIGFFSNTQGPPTAGVNAWTNSINVQRVWGEYMTPVGQLRFGRMPGHWGLGMIENSGDGIDSDFQTTLDRIMFVTGLRSIDLYVGGAWDFVSTGPTSANPYTIYGGQPYNTCNLCNVNEWAAFVAHKTSPDTQRMKLARGDVVLNGGLYAVFRSQYIDVPQGQTPQTSDFSQSSSQPALEPRQAWQLVPDLWVQVLWRKLRVEAEAATIQGQIGFLGQGTASSGALSTNNVNNAIQIRQYGVATQTEFKAIDDKLDLQFGFGWGSGDPWAGSLAAGNGFRAELNQHGPISTFQFNPDYRVDLIFYRHILSRVQGTYYFRPSVDYDFVRHADGERLGGGAA